MHTGAFLGAAFGAGLLLSFIGRRKRQADDSSHAGWRRDVGERISDR
jgi:hypothetical protein